MADHNCVVEICAAWERTILTVQGRYPGVDVDRMRHHIQHLGEERWKAATWGESIPLVDYHSINSAALEEVTAAVFSAVVAG